MQGINFIFSIAILILSVVVHEVSHGYIAYLLGDPTAKRAGRLSMNPLKHLDLTGSFIVPLMLVLLKSSFILGWAKPVPFNPYNLKNQKWVPAIVALAGPATNFLTALVFGLGIRFSEYFSFLPSSFFQIAGLIALVNLQLMILNLIPIPPLDGSRVLQAILPFRWQKTMYVLERYSIFFILIFIFFVWQYLFLPIVANLFKL